MESCNYIDVGIYVYSIYLTYTDHNTAYFFLLQGRFFELGIGQH
jgi:hypothetical protein